MNRLPYVVLVFFLCLAGCESSQKPDAENLKTASQPVADQSSKPSLRDATKLKDTDILPHPEGKIIPGRNYVYCATFQIAWNVLQDNIIKEPILLTGSPPMADLLNKRLIDRNDLSEKDFVADAGFLEKGIVEKIRKQLQATFPGEQPELLGGLPEEGILAYAYLHKTLPFEVPFNKMVRPLIFRCPAGDIALKSFGLRNFSFAKSRHTDLSKQVIILDYLSDNDFILKLDTVSSTNELILAKIPPGKSLQATLASVQERIDKNEFFIDDFLKEKESLVVPNIKIDVLRKYSELLGRFFKNVGFEKYRIVEARQSIRFYLDTTGAKLKSEAIILAKTAKKTRPLRKIRPRQFIFNKPFLLYLKETKSDQPYFAMWIENPELLETITTRNDSSSEKQ